MASAQDIHQAPHQLPPRAARRAGAAWAGRPAGLVRLSHDWWRGFVKVVSGSACLPVFRSVSWENWFMAYNFAGGGDGDQVFLMPPDPRDWLPPQHLAWAMRRAAGEVDLAPFLAAYRAGGQGKRAYHPRMMV